jgi:SpoVK/Ycf46/Vps4 family AAA+-type ATPase
MVSRSDATTSTQYLSPEYRDLQRELRGSSRAATLVTFHGGSRQAMRAAAREFAESLGRPLQSVELRRVVSKYIGETEKNLRAVFEEASRSGAVLFFDEADSLFGSRTPVTDSHDRYSNQETSYLLSAIEDFPVIVAAAVNGPEPVIRPKKRLKHARVRLRPK